MRGRRLFAALLLLWPGSLAAQADPSVERRVHWSLSAGYGFTVQWNRGRSEEQLVLFAPSAAYPLSRSFELFAEGHFSGFFAPDGYMLGIVPFAGRFYFNACTLQPYIALGAGFGWTNLEELDEIDRRFNYLLQGSLGVRRNLSDGSAWTLEARISHISNAGTVRPNLGLNAIVFLGGWRFR